MQQETENVNRNRTRDFSKVPLAELQSQLKNIRESQDKDIRLVHKITEDVNQYESSIRNRRAVGDDTSFKWPAPDLNARTYANTRLRLARPSMACLEAEINARLSGVVASDLPFLIERYVEVALELKSLLIQIQARSRHPGQKQYASMTLAKLSVPITGDTVFAPLRTSGMAEQAAESARIDAAVLEIAQDLKAS